MKMLCLQVAFWNTLASISFLSQVTPSPVESTMVRPEQKPGCLLPQLDSRLTAAQGRSLTHRQNHPGLVGVGLSYEEVHTRLQATKSSKTNQA